MSIDRYLKIVFTVIALALSLLALNPWLHTPQAHGETRITKEERKRMFSKLTDRDLLEVILLAVGEHMGSTPLPN